MTDTERITALEARIAQLEARLAEVERRGVVYQPQHYPSPNFPYIPPTHPVPPWTVTCKEPT